MLGNISCFVGNLANISYISEYSSALDGWGSQILKWGLVVVVANSLVSICASTALGCYLAPERVTVSGGIDNKTLKRINAEREEIDEKLADRKSIAEYLQIPEEAIDSNERLILEKLQDRDLTRIFHETVNSPKRFGRGWMIPFLGIDECCCHESRNFDRTLSHRRQEFENAIVSHFKKNYSTSDRISLCGFGSGGLLQDYIILGKLLEAGFTNIEVDLIDPEYPSELSEEQKLFLELFGKIAPNIQIRFYKNIQDVPSGKKYDVVTAIDCDDLGDPGEIIETDGKKTMAPSPVWEDLLKVKQMLCPTTGRLYLGFDLEDVVWQEDGTLIPMEHQKGKCHAFYHDMKKRPFSKDSVSITLKDYSFLFPVLGMISALVEKGVTTINLTVLGDKTTLPSWFKRVIAENLPKGVQLNLLSSSAINSCDFFIGNDSHPLHVALRSMRDRLFRKQRVDYLQNRKYELGIKTRITTCFKRYCQGRAETLQIDLQPNVQLNRSRFDINFFSRWIVCITGSANIAPDYLRLFIRNWFGPPSLFST